MRLYSAKSGQWIIFRWLAIPRRTRRDLCLCVRVCMWRKSRIHTGERFSNVKIARTTRRCGMCVRDFFFFLHTVIEESTHTTKSWLSLSLYLCIICEMNYAQRPTFHLQCYLLLHIFITFYYCVSPPLALLPYWWLYCTGNPLCTIICL